MKLDLSIRLSGMVGSSLPQVVDLSKARWRKSRASMGGGACVEVAYLENSQVAIRDSKDQAGAVLMPQPDKWQAFLGGIKVGQFDIRDEIYL